MAIGAASAQAAGNPPRPHLRSSPDAKEGVERMKENKPRLAFPAREDFRRWLREHAETSEGVWLVFGKQTPAATLSANDALEEALCFGWIDGQMQRVDDACYVKYFARRRPKSAWSDKNKRAVAALRDAGAMTALGEMAVETAKRNGMWDAPKDAPITDAQADDFAKLLAGCSPAYENFQRMAPSARRGYAGRYLSNKSAEARERDLKRIAERLNQNLKPMERPPGG